MLERINLNLRSRLGTLLLDLLDDLQNALHVPSSTFDDHNPHLRNKRYVDVPNKPRAATHRFGGTHSHPRSIFIIGSDRNLTGDLIVLRRLLIRCELDEPKRRFDPLGTGRIDRNDLRRTLRVGLGKIHRRDDLRPSENVLRTALHPNCVGPPVDGHDLARASFGDHLQLSQLAIVRRRYGQARTSDPRDGILELPPTDPLQFVLAGLNRVG